MQLTDEQINILLAALDAYTYHELGVYGAGTLPCDSGYVLIEPGDTWEEYCAANENVAPDDDTHKDDFDKYQAACALESVLRAQLKSPGQEGA